MPISSCYLFKRLSEPQINRLKEISQEQQIQEGQWLFREGHDAKNLYLIKEGAIELLTIVDEKIEIPISMVRAQTGGVGVSSLVPPHKYSLSARAALDTTLLAFRWADLENLKREDPDLVCIIMTNLAEKLMDRLKETRQELKVHFMNLVRSATF